MHLNYNSCRFTELKFLQNFLLCDKFFFEGVRTLVETKNSLEKKTSQKKKVKFSTTCLPT